MTSHKIRRWNVDALSQGSLKTQRGSRDATYLQKDLSISMIYFLMNDTIQIKLKTALKLYKRLPHVARGSEVSLTKRNTNNERLQE